MKIKLKLKPKEWFEQNAYEKLSAYWESHLDFSLPKIDNSQVPLGVYGNYRYIRGGDVAKGYTTVDTSNDGALSVMWGCDDDFITEHQQYFI